MSTKKDFVFVSLLSSLNIVQNSCPRTVLQTAEAQVSNFDKKSKGCLLQSSQNMLDRVICNTTQNRLDRVLCYITQTEHSTYAQKTSQIRTNPRISLRMSLGPSSDSRFRQTRACQISGFQHLGSIFFTLL